MCITRLYLKELKQDFCNDAGTGDIGGGVGGGGVGVGVDGYSENISLTPH